MSDTSKSLTLEFFINPRCPPGSVLVEVALVSVRYGEMTDAPEEEVLAAVLETDHSKVGEHLSAEVEPSKEPAFPA